MKKRFERFIPSREHVFASRPLSYFRRHLGAHDLWHLNRHSAAGGVAVGFFFAFLVPLGHIPLAVLSAYLIRVNIPVAILATFVNTPLTFPVVYFLCYRIGLAILGSTPDVAADWSFGWFVAHLESILLGALLIATAAAGGGYFLVGLAWHAHTRRRWAARRAQRLSRPQNPEP